MRKVVLVFAFGISPFLLLRCGSQTCLSCFDGGFPDVAPDVDKDASPFPDASNDVVASDASDASSLACTSPVGCGTGTPICCGTVVLNGGTPPNCTASSITSSCKAQCASAFVSNCSGTETVQLCAQGSDCTDPTYDKCCTFTSGNESLTFCATQSMANLSGATCH